MKFFRQVLFLIVVLLIAFPCHALNQLVASGSVTQANMKLSAVDGTAHIDFSAADVLTDYNGCLLKVKDSSGREIVGFIGADGTGETLGADITNGDFSDDTYTDSSVHSLVGFYNAETHDSNNKFTISAGECTCISDGTGTALRVAGLTEGALYYYSIDIISVTSGGLKLSDGGGTFVPVITSTTNGYHVQNGTNAYIYSNSGVTNITFDNMSYRKVTAPSSTGVTIFSEKACTTQNFTAKNSSFNYNDSSGYTYQIFRTPAVEVASGSVTAANTQLSLVDGTAFAYFSGVDLSAYQTGKHLICVYNSATGLLIAMGYCSSTAPSGETLGAELVTNGTFDSDTTGWSVYGDGSLSVDTNRLKVTGLQVGDSGFQDTLSITVGALYRFASTCTTGTIGYRQYFGVPLSRGRYLNATIGSPFSMYVVSDSDVFMISCATNGNGYCFFDDVSLKIVTDCASTGVQIVNSKGGATQSWLKTGSGAVNSDVTYKIYYCGN